MEVDDDAGEDTKHVCRSQVPAFNIRTECIYCGKYMDYEKHAKQPLYQRDRMHESETTELLSSIKRKALLRGDTWGESVFSESRTLGTWWQLRQSTTTNVMFASMIGVALKRSQNVAHQGLLMVQSKKSLKYFVNT